MTTMNCKYFDLIDKKFVTCADVGGIIMHDKSDQAYIYYIEKNYLMIRGPTLLRIPFTGVFDKNGIAAYQDDIVIMKIFFSNNLATRIKAVIKFKDGAYGLDRYIYDPLTMSRIYPSLNDGFEIIGSALTNPEILEGG